MVRPRNGLLTILIVSLLQYVKVGTLGTLCKVDLDQAYTLFEQFYFTVLSFYIIFLISSFLIYPHKLFNIQLGPGTTYLACTRLIVSFALFSGKSMKKGKRESSKTSKSKENEIAIRNRVERENVRQDRHFDFSRNKNYGCTREIGRD